MVAKSLRRTIARTRLAPVAAFPVRAGRVLEHDVRVLGLSARWLLTSREHHNYTYDLTALNRDHLAWFVSEVSGATIAAARGYLDEIEQDCDLRRHIEQTVRRATRRGLADRAVRYGRRIGWYALVRARRPAHVMETGVDKGLGTCVLAAALLRNAAEGHPGRVTAVDINPDAGYLTTTPPWSEVIDLVISDSLAAIPALQRPVDLFLHDSRHTAEHEAAEFCTVEPKLAADALLITDNAAVTDVLSRYAERTGRRFLSFKEEPASHWFPGDAMGVAWRPLPGGATLADQG